MLLKEVLQVVSGDTPIEFWLKEEQACGLFTSENIPEAYLNRKVIGISVSAEEEIDYDYDELPYVSDVWAKLVIGLAE